MQESHLQTWNHIRQKNQRHENIQTWWLSLANHTCVLQATHKPKCLQDQPWSSIFTLQLCIAERESFPKKNDKISCSKTQKHGFALENTTYIVRFKWNYSIEFSVQSTYFIWLKWNHSIEK